MSSRERCREVSQLGYNRVLKAGHTPMIRATEPRGRAVVDMDAAEKLGRIDKVIIDPGARRVAAFQVSRDGALRVRLDVLSA